MSKKVKFDEFYYETESCILDLDELRCRLKSTTYEESFMGRIWCPCCHKAKLKYAQGVVRSYLSAKQHETHEEGCEYDFMPASTSVSNSIGKTDKDREKINAQLIKMTNEMGEKRHIANMILNDEGDIVDHFAGKRLSYNIKKYFRLGRKKIDMIPYPDKLYKSLTLYYGEVRAKISHFDDGAVCIYLKKVIGNQLCCNIKLTEKVLKHIKQDVTHVDGKVIKIAFFGLMRKNDKGFDHCTLESSQYLSIKHV